MHLLLVEDEPAIRTALTRALGRWGHSVTSADSTTQARQEVLETPPDAVISDLKLPDGSGLDLAIDLGLPFIMMSGYGNFDDAVLALRNGCVDFLTKPVALEQLKTALHRLGERHGQAPQVISGANHCQTVQPQACDLIEDSLRIDDFHWPSEAEARAAFAQLDGPLRLRQVAAELMQIPGAQRLVINHHAQGWYCWLPLAADWQAPEHADRRGLIDHLADRVWWRPQGILLECRHEQ